MKFLPLIAVLAATCPALAQQSSEAILDYTEDIAAYVNTTIGWTFQPTSTLTVTSLGCFVDVFANNPAVTAVQVGLWAHDGTLLASNSVTSSSTLFDQTRYEPITPVSLSPGQIYHLGVYYSGGFIDVDGADESFGGSISTSAKVQVRATALGSGQFAFPPEMAGTEGSMWAGPNFRFQSQPLLAIQLSPTNQVRLSWSTAYPGYTVQSKSSLVGVWTNAGLSVTTVGTAFVAHDPIGRGPKFYRLLK
jgi:hypothetical protein